MRILIATNHRSIVGGVETYLRELLPQLMARGHDVALLYERESSASLPTIDESVRGLDRWWLGDDSALPNASRWRPDICYFHGFESPESEEALVERYPTVLFAHAYHGTCVSGTKRCAWPSPRPCGRTMGTACLVHYYPRRCGGLNPLTMFRQYRVQRRRQALLPRYRAILVASHHMREEYLRHGVAEDRVHVVPLFPPGQSPDPEPPRERAPNGRVLMVGRLAALKGGELLVRALPRVRQSLGRPVTLAVAGDGPDRPVMERLAWHHGIRAEFHGWVEPEKRMALMREADVLAVPSVWPEPFGLVGIEAGCVGLPSIAFALGGIPDWLVPGESGELAPADPPSDSKLGEALVRAISDDLHWHRLRRGAWEMAQRFGPEQHIARLTSLLCRCAAIN